MPILRKLSTVAYRHLIGRHFSNKGQTRLTRIFEENGVRKIYLANPKTRNALSLAMMKDLMDDILRTQEDLSLRCIVLLGEGPVFSSGHNLKELMMEGKKDDGSKHFIFACCSRLMKAMLDCPIPIISAVDGMAAAAGCQLVAQSDIAICTEKSSFATPGSRFGIFCSTPGIPVARTVPRKVAAHMLFTGIPITSQEALQAGLVSKVVPNDKLDEEISNICDAIKSQSRSVIEIGKRFFYRQIEMDLTSAYRLGEEVMVNNLQLADAQEGLNSFAEKRKPIWRHDFQKIFTI